MKIAIVHATFYVIGGAENTIIWLTADLLQRGHAVTIFTSEFDRESAIPQAVQDCMVEVPAGGNYSTWLDWALAGIRLRKRLQAFDVVNPHNFPANVWVDFAQRYSRAFPKIVWFCQEPPRLLYEHHTQIQTGRYPARTTHLIAKFRQHGRQTWRKLLQKSLFYLLNRLFSGYFKQAHRKLDQRAAAGCDLILANSQYTAQKVHAIYGRQAQPCQLGVPIHAMPHSPLWTKKDYFLTVTRLEAVKHVDAIIRAVHLLAQERQREPVRLQIIGTGAQEQTLKTLVAELHLEPQITFAGYLPYHSERLHQAYHEALGFIFVPTDEPFGLVPLEAMFHQTAVIGSNEGGLLETVIPGVTGILVTPGASAQIAAAMAMFLDNRQLAIEMGQNGYHHVMQHFKFSDYVDRFEQYLRELKIED